MRFMIGTWYLFFENALDPAGSFTPVIMTLLHVYQAKFRGHKTSNTWAVRWPHTNLQSMNKFTNKGKRPTKWGILKALIYNPDLYMCIVGTCALFSWNKCLLLAYPPVLPIIYTLTGVAPNTPSVFANEPAMRTHSGIGPDKISVNWLVNFSSCSLSIFCMMVASTHHWISMITMP